MYILIAGYGKTWFCKQIFSRLHNDVKVVDGYNRSQEGLHPSQNDLRNYKVIIIAGDFAALDSLEKKIRSDGHPVIHLLGQRWDRIL